MVYSYYNRPAFGSDERLIEFISGSEKEPFTNDFLKAIASLGPNLDDVLDLWMNDEIMLSFTSNKGAFILTEDLGICICNGETESACNIYNRRIIAKASRF